MKEHKYSGWRNKTKDNVELRMSINGVRITDIFNEEELADFKDEIFIKPLKEIYPELSEVELRDKVKDDESLKKLIKEVSEKYRAEK